MSNAKDVFLRTAPFAEMDEAVQKLFLARATEQRFSAGEELFHELSDGDSIYLIVEGKIRLSVELASAHHLSEELECGSGEFVGESCFVAQGPRPATATAKSDIAALVWDVGDWKLIAEEHPRAGYHLALIAGQVLFARVGKLKDHLIDDMAWGLE